MNIDFKDKVVLVTGASAGIGEAIALRFAGLGASVALVGRNVEALNAVTQKCGPNAFAIVADLSTDAGCEKTAKETIEHYGRLDVLVNNAGLGEVTTLLTADMEAYDTVFNLNVRGLYNLTRLLVQDLIKTKGNIVNISSVAATVVSVGSLPYFMTKAAVDHFTRLTALELAPKGVRVNAVSPGLTESKFMMRITGISAEESQQMIQEYAANVPMGKACVGDDIARVVAFVASDNCPLVTGTVIQVDGGSQFTD